MRQNLFEKFVELFKLALCASTLVLAAACDNVFDYYDPGVRTGPIDVRGPLPGLSSEEIEVFKLGQRRFEAAIASGSSNSCASCHSQPTVGGANPAKHPVRLARIQYKVDGSRDGGVHVFSDANRAEYLEQSDKGNLSFRVPLPIFGDGLIESISDAEILTNKTSDAAQKSQLGIYGREVKSRSDGTIFRFGWKAQYETLLSAAEDAFQRDLGLTPTPDELDVVVKFIRYSAPARRAVETASTQRGAVVFKKIGCALCHTPSLQATPAYSDFLLHHMGPGLADNIIQGSAGADEFRTPPLWGLGQRVYFLHDGRTADLVEAIQAHASHAEFGCSKRPALRLAPSEMACDSEANKVIETFNQMKREEKQDVLNFLRSL